MWLVICWVIFCAIHLISTKSVPLYSSIAESIFWGVSGFVIYTFGWLYQVFWKTAKGSIFLQIFKTIWWPISPLFFWFGGEVNEISRVLLIAFLIASWGVFICLGEKNYLIFERIAPRNKGDFKWLSGVKKSTDILWLHLLYWGLCAWVVFA